MKEFKLYYALAISRCLKRVERTERTERIELR